MVACAVLAIDAHGSAVEDRGASVAVVYNLAQPGSQELAEYYARRRAIPANHLFGFKLPVTESMNRAEFEQTLQRPLLKALERERLLVFRTEGSLPIGRDKAGTGSVRMELAQIRYVVLCYGVPVKISAEAGLSERGMEEVPALLRRNEASVDSELAWLPQYYEKPRLTGTLVNQAYGTKEVSGIGPTKGMFMVSRLDGPDVTVSRRLVDQALTAEQYGLWGRAYIDARGLTNGPYLLGDEVLLGAANLLRQAGLETVVDTNEATFSRGFPMSQAAFYAGWYDANVSGPFNYPPVEFMPGAFAYHLHSFSARPLRTRAQGWAGPLLERGAAATVGYGEEPYLNTTLDIQRFTGHWIFDGATYGEAVYAALPVLSWQTCVVGDPLYAPYARPSAGLPLGARLQQLHLQLAAQTNALVEWSHLQVVNLGSSAAGGVSGQDMMDYVRGTMTALKSPVLAEKMGDMLWESGGLAPAIEAYAQSLEWGGSRKQRLRVMLQLIRLRDLFTQDAAALDTCEALLKEFPDYPDRLDVMRQGLVLATGLGRSETAARFEKSIAEAGATGR
jgi:uncharacterized protein (TIGR03790 family)